MKKVTDPLQLFSPTRTFFRMMSNALQKWPGAWVSRMSASHPALRRRLASLLAVNRLLQTPISLLRLNGTSKASSKVSRIGWKDHNARYPLCSQTVLWQTSKASLA